MEATVVIVTIVLALGIAAFWKELLALILASLIVLIALGVLEVAEVLHAFSR
jgi:hypothetical protein